MATHPGRGLMVAADRKPPIQERRDSTDAPRPHDPVWSGRRGHDPHHDRLGRLRPPASATGRWVAEPATQVIHHGGRVGWQMALIVAAAVTVIGLTTTLVARRARAGSHRPAVS